MDWGEVEEDFEFLKEDERVLAVLAFGSQVKGTDHERSDIDICVVAPGSDPFEVMRTVWQNLWTEKYDVHVFEEFSLKMKHQVIAGHEVVWTRDLKQLEEHLHRYRRLWNDQAAARELV